MVGEDYRRVGTATHRLMESYKDDYPSHAKGIFQEAIQNSVDARLTPAGFKDLTIVLSYDPQERTLRIRDYGTSGMSHCDQCDWGVKPGTNEDCHEADCRWGNFHYLGGLSKGGGELGYRGQGKSLAIVGGTELTVRTKLVGAEHLSMASVWLRRGEEWYWRKAPELGMTRDDKPGTELVIKGVIPELHEQLLDKQPLIKDVSEMWFRVIERGTTIRYGFVGKSLDRIGLPQLPHPSQSKGGAGTTRHRDRIPVSAGHRVVGELEDVSMFVAETPLPESLRGLALVKNGTQVIERVNRWGRRIPVELQDRFFGWVTYFCTSERPFLLKCERPGHRGFTPHTFYTRTLDLLQQQVEELLLPLVKQELRPKITEKDRRRAQQNLLVLQRAFAENAEFNPWSGEGQLARERTPRPPPTVPYVSEIRLDRAWYGRGDSARVSVVLQNPQSSPYPFAHLTIEGLDDGMSPVIIDELPPGKLPVIPAAKGDEKGRLLAESNILITPDFATGRNWVRCTLTHDPPNVEGQPMADEAPRRLDRRGHELWVDAEPPARTHGPPKGGPTGEGNRPATIRGINPISEGEVDMTENELIPFWDVGEFWFFTKGTRIGPVYDKQPRTADSILYELIAESVADKIAQTHMDTDPREVLDKSQILEEYRRIEDARRRFLRSCERFRSTESEL